MPTGPQIVLSGDTNTFEYHAPCGHTYQVPFTPCTEVNSPGCRCGKPYQVLPENYRCPVCKNLPGFLARPMWTHLGVGMMNPKGMVRLEIYRS